MTSPATLSGPETVTVIGAGVFGLSCAFALILRGARVRVIEARHIGAGASGGHVGALAPHAPENWNTKKALQRDSLLAAPAFWAAVEARSGLPSGYGRSGRLQPVPDTRSLARMPARIAAASLHWPAAMVPTLTDNPQSAHVPPSPTGFWLHDGLTARVNPRAACTSLAAAIRASGGEIAEGIAAHPDAIPGPAIWATGAEGLDMLGRDLGRPAGRGVKGQSLLLAHAAPDCPQIFADGLHIVFHADGTTAVGSTSENNFTHDRPDGQADELLARAITLCPPLGGAPVLDIWAGIRPRAESRAPLLAPWPDRPGHIIANGGFKIGFGMAPLIADLAARLATAAADGTTPPPIPDLFAL